jgi:hypothetical protein
MKRAQCPAVSCCMPLLLFISHSVQAAPELNVLGGGRISAARARAQAAVRPPAVLLELPWRTAACSPAGAPLAGAVCWRESGAATPTSRTAPDAKKKAAVVIRKGSRRPHASDTLSIWK